MFDFIRFKSTKVAISKDLTAAFEEYDDSSDEDAEGDDMSDGIGLAPALLQVFQQGFRRKTVLGPNKHPWDFIHRAVRQMKPGIAVDCIALMFNHI